MRRKQLLLPALALILLTACHGAHDHAERMSREHAGDRPVPSPAATEAPAAPSGNTEVVYADLDGDPIRGYLARPADGRPAPGILVIQEWWGLNANIRAMADRLAGEGYIALAVDFYEGEVADDRDGARALMQRAMSDPSRVLENLRQAREYLAATAGATSVGTIGWCFGGGWSLRAALELGDGIDAAVMYYGRVVTEPAELAALTAPLLGHFGALDRGIPLDGVRQMEAALDDLGKEATIHVYEDADHAFANPSGARYQAEAAELAWERTLAFFAENLG